MREYSLKFNYLAWYVLKVVATMEDRVHGFVNRLDSYLVRYCTIASLNKAMGIESMQAFAQKLEGSNTKKKVTKIENREFTEGQIHGEVYTNPR